MLPSMPILFTRDSQDAFGNKIQPSTSFSQPFDLPKIVSKTEPPPLTSNCDSPKAAQKENKIKESVKKKEESSRVDNNALETALIRSYYTKVQSRFSSNQSVPTNKFVQFSNILKNFDPRTETPVNLYKKIEELFGDEHKDIVEEFLLFLKPGQAAEMGRFMDYFMLNQMSNFIDMLQKTFARKPTVLRKILRALTTGLNSGSTSLMRSRVCPHLRSNPRLLKMFYTLLPDERPPDSVYETGTDNINESFLTDDKGYDVWDFDEPNDNKRKLEAKESLDTVYLHGRVFLQHGRLLRHASVNFPYSKEPYRVQVRRLAPAQSHPSPPESDEERASPKRNNRINTKVPTKRPRKQLKSPIKTVKDVNDNTKNNCTTVTNSPKVAKNKNKTKTCKDTVQKAKKEKLEAKVNGHHKNSEPKLKQVKFGIVNTEEKLTKHKLQSLDIDINKAHELKMETVASDTNREDEEIGNRWTREEDKTMLEVMKGEAGSEQVFGRIRELLPHRSTMEIKERFYHVMNLLQQMAVGKVT